MIARVSRTEHPWDTGNARKWAALKEAMNGAEQRTVRLNKLAQAANVSAHAVKAAFKVWRNNGVIEVEPIAEGIFNVLLIDADPPQSKLMDQKWHQPENAARKKVYQQRQSETRRADREAAVALVEAGTDDRLEAIAQRVATILAERLLGGGQHLGDDETIVKSDRLAELELKERALEAIQAALKG